MIQKPMLIYCGRNRVINLNHIAEVTFHEETYEDYNETFWTVTIKFSDGVREEITLSQIEFETFARGISNALV